MGEQEFLGIPGIAFGIMLALIAKLSASLGLIVKKMSHNDEEAKGGDESEHTPMVLRPKWWCGLALLAIIPGVCDGWALMYAPLSVIAPLAGTTIVFNTILAIWCLKEETNTLETAGACAILAGVAFTSVFGSRHTEEYSAEQLADLFVCIPMYIYYALIFLVVAASVVVINLCKHIKGLHAFAYGNIAGCLGGQQNLLLKGTAELLFRTFSGDNQFNKFATYPIVIGFPVLAIAQMVVLNMGLAQHDAVSYIPTYQAAFAMYGAIAGGIYFQEWYDMGLFKACMFILGLGMVLFGLVLIGRSRSLRDAAAAAESSALASEDSDDKDDVIHMEMSENSIYESPQLSPEHQEGLDAPVQIWVPGVDTEPSTTPTSTDCDRHSNNISLDQELSPGPGVVSPKEEPQVQQ